MLKRNSFKVIIGRDLMIDFPDLNLEGVAARVDSGAYRSAIHARNIREKDGVLHFQLLGGHTVFGPMAKDYSTTHYDTVNVENSFGHSQTRYQVTLKVKLGTKKFNAQFSLADRKSKKYPILLGRTLLSDRFIVDTSLSNLDRIYLKKQGVTMPMDEEKEYS